METVQVVVIGVLALLVISTVVGFIWYNKWLDKKMSAGCQGQVDAILSIILVSYLIVLALVGVSMTLIYFFGGAVIFTAFMIPVKYNFTWGQIILYGGALGIIFMVLRYAWGQLIRGRAPSADVMELRN